MASDLIERLRTEADLCRNETVDDVAALLDEAATEIERVKFGHETALAAWKETEAELAALDLKVHGAPFIEATKARGVGARIECEGLPADWIGQRVALLPVGGEG